VARVFISHSSTDLAAARTVADWMEAAGHTVFLSGDLRAGIVVGEAWVERLFAELARADALLTLVTAAFRRSEWCAAEVGAARATGLLVLPVQADPNVVSPLLPAETTQWAVLDGDGRAAREQLLEALRRLDGADSSVEGTEVVYPGLAPFTTGQARMFFGRAEETRRLADRLRVPPGPDGGGLVPVVGPSGSGKSSMVRAGLVPLLAADRDWLVLAPLVPAALPGADPTGELTRLLAAEGQARRLGWSAGQVAAALARPGGLTGLVTDLLAAASARWMLLVIDQAEELLTHTGEEDRRRFAGLVWEATGGRVRALATIRSDYLDLLLLLAADTGLPVREVFPVAPLRRDLLPLVVTGPARRAVISVDEELLARLVADTGTGEGMPLLAFTLAELADGVGRGGALSAERYERLGGVQGALIRQADRALAAATVADGVDDTAVLATLLRLVTVDAHGQVTRSRAYLEDFGPAARAQLSVFVEHRILTTHTDTERGEEDRTGRALVDIVHEQVLTSWPRLRQAIANQTDSLRLRSALTDAAELWDREKRPAGHLWDHERTDAARRAVDPLGLTPAAQAFLAASAAHAAALRARRRRIAVIAFTTLLILLAGTSIAAGLALSETRTAATQKNAAVAAKRTAITRQLLAQADSLRAADPRTALQLDVAADRIHPGVDTRDAVATALTAGYRSSLPGLAGPVYSMAFSPDGRILAAGGHDHMVRLWDTTNPAAPRPLGQHLTDPDSVLAVAFSPAGRILAVGGYSAMVHLWDMTNPAATRPLGQPLTGLHDAVSSVAFSSNGLTLAVGSYDRTVHLWDMTNPAAPRPLGQPLTGPTDLVSSVAFSPDGRTLAAGSHDHLVHLWDTTDPAAPRPLGQPLTGPTDLVSSVAFSPDGRTLAAGSYDHLVHLWDTTDPAAPRPLGQPLTGPTEAVSSVAFSPDGRTLAAGDRSGEVRLWDITDRSAPRLVGRPLAGATNIVRSLVFSPDSHTLAAGRDGQTVTLWDMSDPTKALRRLGQPSTSLTDSIFSVAFSPDGQTLAAGSSDHTVNLWTVTNPREPRPLGQPLTGLTGPASSVAFSPDGRTLAAGSYDHTVRLWDAATPAAPHPLGQPLTGPTGPVLSVAFSPNGRTLAASGPLDPVRLWDMSRVLYLRDHAPAEACALLGTGLDPTTWSQYIPDLPYQQTCGNPR